MLGIFLGTPHCTSGSVFFLLLPMLPAGLSGAPAPARRGLNSQSRLS